jgi:RHH-type proline utilization regulon transcriptional repressor/proline dehydrogenase/delta 1-pyrroline-5-carboxylate dehydrogenase
LLRLAEERGAFVNIDMEQHRYKDLVHRVFAEILQRPELRGFSGVGIVVQAYLKDAANDIARLRVLAERRGAPITVRLVKGAYWEEERIVAAQNDWPVPVYEDKAATDASYERCTDALLDAWPHLRPAFGTHNPRSIAQAAVKAKARGVAGEIEFQMLFGMAEELREAVAREGFRTRVYVPAGAVVPGMAYLVRRLLENTSNQSWFIKGERTESWDEVLAAPAPPAAPAGEQSTGFKNTSTIALHDPAVREKAREALQTVSAAFPLEDQPLLLAGRDVIDRRLAEVRYPADPSLLLGRVAQATREDVEEAVRAARAAVPAWRDS